MRAALLALFLLSPVAFGSDSPGKVPKGEPGAADRPVGAWILDLRNGPDAKRVTALARLGELGPKAREAVPDLVAALSHPEERIRNLAVEALGSVGPGAKAAAPALRNVFQVPGESYLKREVAVALFRITNTLDKDLVREMIVGGGGKRIDPCEEVVRQNIKAVVPFAIELLSDTRPEVRVAAARLLGSLGQPPKGEQPTLAQLGATAKTIGPALVSSLDDLAPEVAKAAALALAKVEPKLCDKAVPYVLRALKGNQIFEYEATTILRPAAAVAVPALIKALDEKDGWARTQFARALACLEEARVPLETALGHASARVRAGAAEALGCLGEEARASAPALVAALRDGERPVRLAAAEALVAMRSRVVEAVAVLAEIVTEGNESERQAAAALLLSVGPPARAALPALKRSLEDGREEVRFTAALAVVAIDPAKASGAVPALVEGLERDSLGGRFRAAAALAKLGPAARSALPRLKQLMEERETHLAVCAAEAVARIDPSLAPQACRVIGDVLLLPRRRGHALRGYAIRALRDIGPGARPALPALLFVLHDEDGPCLPQAALAAVEIDATSAAAAVAFIRDELNDTKHGEDITEFLEELPTLGPKAALFLPELKQMIAGKRPPFYAMAAALTLAAIGPEARDAVPLLRERLKTEKDTDCREAIKQALAALAGEKR
jgi:HEAT repeat protein